jgi:hypothetical protein
MLEAPIGSARFNNEFGRPCLTGTFRTLLTNTAESEAPEYRGYHKPIMVSTINKRKADGPSDITRANLKPLPCFKV